MELTFHLPWFGRTFGLETAGLRGAILHLSTDERGRANWQAVEPGTAEGAGLPSIRGLSVPDATVHLDDERRHLKFDGTVSTLQGAGAGSRIRFVGTGQLNGRHAELALSGDALTSARRHQPYGFEYSAQSAGSRLEGHGSLANPFDFTVLETGFEAVGPDLKNLYFLTGVSLPETGAYRLSGRLVRKGDHLEFDHLRANSGQSDILADITIESHLNRPSHLEAQLSSQRLRWSDVGKRAPGGSAASPDREPLALPQTPLRLSGSRDADAVIRFHANRLEAGHATFRQARATVRIEHGSIEASPLDASLGQGAITGGIRIDATRPAPAVTADLHVSGLELQQFHADGSVAPVDGSVDARIKLQGSGHSVHEIASDANGKLTAVLPQGSVRASLAELAGLDLRALGLLGSRSAGETGIRCGVADFDLSHGTLTARTLIIDTEPVLITGQGTIALDSESLDLRLEGRPKHPRLRVRAPVLVRGTMRQPRFSVQPRNVLAQAGGAIALGMLLTPVAAMLAFIDPGLAKNQDCASLLAREQRPLEGSRPPAPPLPSRP